MRAHLLVVAGGKWLVSDQPDDDSADWRVREFNLADLRWRILDIKKVVEGKWEPALRKRRPCTSVPRP